MKRLHAALQRLGPSGTVAIGVLLFWAAFQATALRPAERELESLRLAAAPGALPAADYGRFYRQFPPVERLPDELERLYALARAAKVELQRADYRLEDRGGALAAYQITLPLHGSYPQIRTFIGAVLQAMPTLSLDALRLERRKADDGVIDVQLRLTAYFRAMPQEPSR